MLALAAVTVTAALASVVGGAHLEVGLVCVGAASLLALAFVRARGIVSPWPETSGSGLPSRVTHPRSSSSPLPWGPNRKVG